MPSKHAVNRTLLASVALAAILALPRTARAGDDSANRAAAASDPEYAGHLTSFSAMQKMKAMDVMNMIDADHKGYVTREEFLKFQEKFFDRMDRKHSGKVTPQQWMGTETDTGGTAAGDAAKQ